MSSIWNFANPLTSGSLKLAKSGRELYGTVVRAGLSKKTVSVKVNRFFYDQKYRKTYSRTGLFHVHDEEEFCRVGDKVVIQSCRPMSKLKRYFVRNVVVMAGRPFELGAVTADKKVEMLEEKNRLKVEQMAKEKAEEDAKVEKKLDPIWLGLVEDMKFEERTGRNFEYRKDVARKSPDNSFEQKKGKKLNEGRKGLKKNELEKDILESKGQNVGNLGNEEAGVGLGGKEEIIDRSEVKEVKKEIEENYDGKDRSEMKEAKEKEESKDQLEKNEHEKHEKTEIKEEKKLPGLNEEKEKTEFKEEKKQPELEEEKEKTEFKEEKKLSELEEKKTEPNEEKKQPELEEEKEKTEEKQDKHNTKPNDKNHEPQTPEKNRANPNNRKNPNNPNNPKNPNNPNQKNRKFPEKVQNSNEKKNWKDKNYKPRSFSETNDKEEQDPKDSKHRSVSHSQDSNEKNKRFEKFRNSYKEKGQYERNYRKSPNRDQDFEEKPKYQKNRNFPQEKNESSPNNDYQDRDLKEKRFKYDKSRNFYQKKDQIEKNESTPNNDYQDRDLKEKRFKYDKSRNFHQEKNESSPNNDFQDRDSKEKRFKYDNPRNFHQKKDQNDRKDWKTPNNDQDKPTRNNFNKTPPPETKDINQKFQENDLKTIKSFEKKPFQPVHQKDNRDINSSPNIKEKFNSKFSPRSKSFETKEKSSPFPSTQEKKPFKNFAKTQNPKKSESLTSAEEKRVQDPKKTQSLPEDNKKD